MKKSIFILIICLGLSVFSIGQSRFGITAGAGTSRIDNYRRYFTRFTYPEPWNVAVNNYANISSWNVGFYYQKVLPIKRFEIGSEVLVDNIGAYVQEFNINYDFYGPYRERLTYLSVPLYLRFKAKGGWYSQIGLTNNFLLSKQQPYRQFHFYDLGLNLALSFCLSEKMYFEIHGFHSIKRSNVAYPFEETYDDSVDWRLFNSSITVSLKYELWKKK
jgi:hypothetical protein